MIINPSQKKRIIRILFFILLLLIGIISLQLNINHRAEQGIYEAYHKVLGINLFNGLGYRFDPVNYWAQTGFTEINATFPLWGYPIIVGLIQNDLVIMVIQVIAIMSLLYLICYQYIDNFYFLLFVPLFLPIALHATVRWADTWNILSLLILFFSLIKYVKNEERIYLVITLLVSMVGVNIRPDFLYFIIFLFVTFIVFRKFRISASIALAGAIIGLIPWLIYTWDVTGKPLIGSTNGGLVAYISLGQLPNNPWGRIHNDMEGFNYVRNFGEATPITSKSDSLLRQKVLDDIEKEPRAFINKVFHNFCSALTGGVYAGDNQLFISKITKYILVSLIIVQIHFTVYSLKSKIPKDRRLALYYSWVIVIFSFIWVSLLQYQPRHLNGVYAILLVTAIIFTSWIRSDSEKVI